MSSLPLLYSRGGGVGCCWSCWLFGFIFYFFPLFFLLPFFSTLSCLSPPAAHSGRNHNFHRLLREQRRHRHRRRAQRTHRVQRPLQPQWSGIWTSHAMINTLCTIVNFFNSHGSLFSAAFLSVLPYSLALPLAGVQRHGERGQHSIREHYSGGEVELRGEDPLPGGSAS